MNHTWPAPPGKPVARLSAATAGEIGAADDDLVTVRTERGEITLPLADHRHARRHRVAADELPRSAVYRQLGVTAGAVVSIGRAYE